ncbi:MAG: LysE family translocator [Marinobacter sp.]|uniref:LysE family translocator n=1 Tax=Marinobacter sp. TaxID=50741 RepID=UPI00299ECC11|nr:LysE family translocator [Marinobacter sp.]MDX1634411.1 LysE family translocator [Marinobacter sp.]
MPPLDLLWAFALATLLLTLTPGVDTLLVLRNTARGGLGDGLVSSFGICCGLFVHATLSAIGISLILVQTAWAFSALKWAGACYLIWLGLSSLYQAVRPVPEVAVRDSARKGSVGHGRAFREGVLSNLLNPKTALFYMAFLPQFIDPAGPAFLQSILLAGIHFVMAMVWQSALAVLVVRSHRVKVNPRVKRFMHFVTGGVFVGFGARLAFTQP